MQPIYQLCTTAPAKINLGLQVLEKRGDGFHALNTIFCRIPFGDRLWLRREPIGRSVRLHSFGIATDCPEKDNLAYRAATLFLDHFRLAGRITVILEKRIPTGAGLGGGSSDAAAVLKGLATLYGLTITPDIAQELATLALQLGSDVPFFMLPEKYNSALGKGRGEVLTPIALQLPPALVLALPAVHVATGDAYAALKRTSEPIEERHFGIQQHSQQPQKLQFTELFNDFECAVLKKYPPIATAKHIIALNDADIALMSGSGAAVFGLFSHIENAKKAVNDLRKEEINAHLFFLDK